MIILKTTLRIGLSWLAPLRTRPMSFQVPSGSTPRLLRLYPGGSPCVPLPIDPIIMYCGLDSVLQPDRPPAADRNNELICSQRPPRLSPKAPIFFYSWPKTHLTSIYKTILKGTKIIFLEKKENSLLLRNPVFTFLGLY